jgi:hypothetical protein
MAPTRRTRLAIDDFPLENCVLWIFIGGLSGKNEHCVL